MDEFIKDILAICEKHNMYLSHQDSQGAFIVVNAPDERYRNILVNWFKDAEQQ